MIRVRNSRWVLGVALAGIPLLMAGCPFLPPGADGTTTGGVDPFDDVEESLNNTAPVANAGDDQTVSPGQSVALSGIASTDADNDRLGYLWRQVGGSPTVELEQGFSAIARFEVPSDVTEATTLTFSLTVTDGFAADVDRVRLTIQP